MEKTFNLADFNYQVIIGKYANQADGAVWFQQGGTVLLATVCSATSSDFPGFLPLTIDYREHFSAAGKIPGGYLKREGKFSDKEILISRLIDRAIRPLFPENYFNQIQILVTVYSVDKEHTPYTLALIASSLALSISKIPFLGPIGAVEIGRLNGEWIVNPTLSQAIASDVKITVAGTTEGITMVEGRTNKISEKEFVDAMFLAHSYIKKQIEWQSNIQKEIGKEKEIIANNLDWDGWTKRAESFLTQERVQSLQIRDKNQRGTAMSSLEQLFVETFEKEREELGISKTFVGYIYDSVLKQKLTELIFHSSKRIDGRSFDEVRAIQTEVGLLPFNHGSAFFQRGRTQALVSVTLGGGQDEQRVEDIMLDTVEKTFMLHYNFPPFSVGEVRQSRGPGRREIGHGNLAASALKYVLPTPDKFPYTIRIVADMLESDGSTSMATVCGSTMALMQAGVPISNMVSGIAMGLVADKNGNFQVLSDIAGIEDAFGLMDFKVAGTENGVTAIQMDIKYKGGLKREVFEKALAQALKGRIHILDEMKKVMSSPNVQLSALVPQIISLRISKDKIGAIIGQGGKTIREITSQTDTSIDIEEDGLVKILGQAGPKLDQAINWVKTLAGQIEPGMTYTGKIKKLAEFGMFVEIAPGQDGLVHVSSLPKDLQQTFHKTFKVDDVLKVSVIDYDSNTGRIRLKIVQ